MRTAAIQTHVSPEERIACEVEARRQGVTLSTLLRAAIVAMLLRASGPLLPEVCDCDLGRLP